MASSAGSGVALGGGRPHRPGANDEDQENGPWRGLAIGIRSQRFVHLGCMVSAKHRGVKHGFSPEVKAWMGERLEPMEARTSAAKRRGGVSGGGEEPRAVEDGRFAVGGVVRTDDGPGDGQVGPEEEG